MEGSSADAVHVDITSVTKPGVNPSLMLISVTQLGTVLEPAIMGNLVLLKSTPIIKESNPITAPSILVEGLKEEAFLAKIKDNDEALLAYANIPDMAPIN